MNNSYRRIVTGIAAAFGSYLGIWAYFFPRNFYDNFPGLGSAWVAADGPFNEHLIRDFGGLYLGIVAACVWAIFRSDLIVTRIIGLALAIFGALHLVYHSQHLGEYAPIDVIGNILTLGTSLLLGILMFLPGRKTREVSRANLEDQNESEAAR
ncbi:MAG: hypothetical protein IT191_05515 [Microbacteriaceae bacterium]|nr:hypothetical protein [Cryobacterium sp.]MCC6376459.1 hypothetical protein [Microbacteriaceae bacterium]